MVRSNEIKKENKSVKNRLIIMRSVITVANSYIRISYRVCVCVCIFVFVSYVTIFT